MIGRQGGVGRAARQFGLATLVVDDETVGAVALEDAAHITDVVQQAGDDKMGEVGRLRRHQQRAALDDVVAGKRHQHGMFDIIVKRVAIADALERKPRHRGDKLGQPRLGRAETAVHMFGEKEPKASAAKPGTVITLRPSRARRRQCARLHKRHYRPGRIHRADEITMSITDARQHYC